MDPDPDTRPTVAARPAPSRPSLERRTPASLGTPSSAALTPAGVLRRDSMSHARLLAGAGIGVCLFGLIATVFIGGGTPTSRLLLGSACGGLIVVCLAALYVTRSGGDAPPILMFVIGQAVCIASIGVYAFWGIYSPGVAIFILGLYLYANVVDRGFAVAGYLSLALIHAGMWGLITAGVIPDIGIIRGDSLVMRDKVMSFATPQLFMLVTFLWSRLSRRATLRSMTELDTAVRTVAVREALLNEARLDLERARSGPGLFTGQVIGSYRLGDVIGRGGMGEVYEGNHVDSGDPAAIKLLHRHMLGDLDKVERFLREVQVVSSLDPAHIPGVLEHSEIDSALPYLAMERLIGQDLSSLLHDRGRLDPAGTGDLLKQVAAGLDAAHAAGVVHRDLKPANLFLSEDARWKILDFGISKLGTGSGTLTRGGVIGTPGYMAPEQIEGKAVDARADVFSLAAVAYRCLTSRPVFVGDEAAVMFQTVKKMPPPPSALSHAPDAVDAVLAIGLAKDPDARFESAGQLAAAFQLAVDSKLPAELRDRAEAATRRWPWA